MLLQVLPRDRGSIPLASIVTNPNPCSYHPVGQGFDFTKKRTTKFFDLKEKRLSTEIKKLEAIYQQKLNDMDELKKSVRQKAFEGEL